VDPAAAQRAVEMAAGAERERELVGQAVVALRHHIEQLEAQLAEQQRRLTDTAAETHAAKAAEQQACLSAERLRVRAGSWAFRVEWLPQAKLSQVAATQRFHRH
jgi:phage shock protein A